jgi:hypothetical protein
MNFHAMVLYTAMGPVTITPDTEITWIDVLSQKESARMHKEAGDKVSPEEIVAAMQMAYRIHTPGARETYIVPVETISGIEISE